jgi:hypothetical protein
MENMNTKYYQKREIRMRMNKPESDVNFVCEYTTQEDKELFFGPLEGNENFITIGESWIMAHIVCASDNFPSASQARKNGWNKKIPTGFTMLKVGKKAKMKEIFILKQ